MIGYIYTTLYILFITLASIWVDKLGESVDIATLLFVGSLVAVLFFNLLRFKQCKSNHLTILKAPILWLLMNATIVGTWWFTYYGIIHASARMLNAVFFLAIAFCSCIKNKKLFGLVACMISLGAIFLLSPESTVLSMLACFIAGFFGYCYINISKQYADKFALPVLDLLAIRFYGLVLFSFIYLIHSNTFMHLLTLSTSPILGFLVLLGMVHLVIPNYLSQSGIQFLGAHKFSIFTTLLPVIGFIIQGLFFHDWPLPMFFACVFATISLNYGLICNLLKFYNSILTGFHFAARRARSPAAGCIPKIHELETSAQQSRRMKAKEYNTGINIPKAFEN